MKKSLLRIAESNVQIAALHALKGVYALKGKYTYRLRYEKTPEVRYVSHLDFVRVLNRTVRRSGLPITYTEGFNPHPVMMVAMPLSVGVTSEDEYIDIDFDEKVDEAEVLKRFNDAFGGGFVATAVKCIGEGDLSLKKLDEAKYRVIVEQEGTDVPDIETFLSRDTIVVSKKSKSATKDVDIKNDIKSLEIVKTEGNYIVFDIDVPAGNEYNLKPELVVHAMDKYLDGFNVKFVLAHRTALLCKGQRFI
ncbi:MAG: DUF2344 domain-containing protein [Ruminococcaceae bacterium]|nr:DUF2344 domain-containing protein [Oscillospiraceae bacterium]